MTNEERAARYLGTVWATVSPEQIDALTAEFDAVEREAKVASKAPPLGPMASTAVVTGTPYLVALFPLTCHCGVDLHDLAACFAHECVRPSK